MTAVNTEIIKAAMERACDSIPPRQAQIVTVFVSGYQFDDEASKQLYHALLTCEDWQKSYLTLDIVSAYCETHGILWGTSQVISTTHYPKGLSEGHFVIEAIVTPRVKEEAV